MFLMGSEKCKGAENIKGKHSRQRRRPGGGGSASHFHCYNKTPRVGELKKKRGLFSWRSKSKALAPRGLVLCHRVARKRKGEAGVCVEGGSKSKLRNCACSVTTPHRNKLVLE